MAPLIPTTDDTMHLRGQRMPENILQRVLMERLIVRKACTDLLAAGFILRVHDGEAYSTGRTTDLATVMAAIMATDEEFIYAYERADNSDTGYALVGTLVLIYGNDGWDVIADNSASMEPHLAGATALSDALCDETYDPAA